MSLMRCLCVTPFHVVACTVSHAVNFAPQISTRTKGLVQLVSLLASLFFSTLGYFYHYSDRGKEEESTEFINQLCISLGLQFSAIGIGLMQDKATQKYAIPFSLVGGVMTVISCVFMCVRKCAYNQTSERGFHVVSTPTGEAEPGFI